MSKRLRASSNGSNPHSYAEIFSGSAFFGANKKATPRRIPAKARAIKK